MLEGSLAFSSVPDEMRVALRLESDAPSPENVATDIFWGSKVFSIVPVTRYDAFKLLRDAPLPEKLDADIFSGRRALFSVPVVMFVAFVVSINAELTKLHAAMEPVVTIPSSVMMLLARRS